MCSPVECGAGEPGVVHGLGHGGTPGAEVGGDGLLAGHDGLGALEHVVRRGPGGRTAMPESSAMTRSPSVDRDAGDGDRLAPASLADESAAGGARADAAGEDGKAELARLGDVAAGAVGEDPAGAVRDAAEAEQPAPAGNVGAAVVGHHDHRRAGRAGR